MPGAVLVGFGFWAIASIMNCHSLASPQNPAPKSSTYVQVNPLVPAASVSIALVVGFHRITVAFAAIFAGAAARDAAVNSAFVICFLPIGWAIGWAWAPSSAGASSQVIEAIVVRIRIGLL